MRTELRLAPGIGATFYGNLPRDVERHPRVVEACNVVTLHTLVNAADVSTAARVRQMNPRARVWIDTPANYLSRMDNAKGRAAVMAECDRMADIVADSGAEAFGPNGEGSSDGKKEGDWTWAKGDTREEARLESLAEDCAKRWLERLDKRRARVALTWTSHDGVRSFRIPRRFLALLHLHAPQHYPADVGIIVSQRMLERRIAWSRGQWEVLADAGMVSPSLIPGGDRWSGYYQGHGHALEALVWALSETPLARLWACPESWSDVAVEALELAQRVRRDFGTGPDTIEKLQRAKGLDADGIVGKKTIAAVRTLAPFLA